MSNKLTADAIASLVSADIPKLKRLNLACNHLGTAAARHISKSTWLDLCSLSLQNNAFDNAAMAFLARGNWPHLMELRVFGNEVCVLGLELLMAGQWPCLRHLVLDGTLVTAASWTLLDLSGPLPDCESIQTMGFLCS